MKSKIVRLEKAIISLFIFITMLSCKRMDSIKSLGIEHDSIYVSDNKSLNEENSSIDDSVKILITEYQSINIYTENVMRGKGVIDLTVEDKIEILNIDKSFFGSISLEHQVEDYESETYNIEFKTKNIIVREFLPQSEFGVFCFDSENPEKDENYIIIYINKEKKLIRKNRLNYKFLDWDSYIKSAFVRPFNSENKYWYEVIQLKKDSMLIKSVDRSRCDYFDEYKNEKKWIKWKNNSSKNIELNFCY